MATVPKTLEKGPTIKWKSSLANTILDVLKAKSGWVETKSATDWDFFWCSRDWMNQHYIQYSFREHQRICHFRNDYELTRKDNMARNIKKVRRQLEKEGRKEEAARYQFIPASYILPIEYHMFVEEFRTHPAGTIWIMKPVAGAQGRGIFLFRQLRDITEWKKTDVMLSDDVDSYVAQQYIANPYLIGGKKFDLRVYVLVTSFVPLRAWLNREGFARFSGSRYSMVSIDDAYVHLTNVAVQKTAPDYDPEKGVKWSMEKLRRFMIARHGLEAVLRLLSLMDEIFILSLHAVQKIIMSDKHCFEMYGYDIMIDSNLKPWLIEVNASPSLTPSSKDDFDMKFRVLNDLLDVVDMEGKRTGNETRVGGFDMFWNDGPVYAPKAEGEPYEAELFKPKINTFLGCVVPGRQ